MYKRQSGSNAEYVDVDISGASTLTLLADLTTSSNGNCQTVWADAKVKVRAEGSELYLSDVEEESAKVGYGNFTKDANLQGGKITVYRRAHRGSAGGHCAVSYTHLMPPPRWSMI